MSGGYRDRYRSCGCVWGEKQGSLVTRLVDSIESSGENLNGRVILDAGCGEGKNAVYLKCRGAEVYALDMEAQAIENGRRYWDPTIQPNWLIADVRKIKLEPEKYDIIIAYGLFHCFSSKAEIQRVLTSFMEATLPGGYNVIVSINDRIASFDGAHDDGELCLLPNRYYIDRYSNWDIIRASDEDYPESHLPENIPHPSENIPHTHSVTRLLSRKPPAGASQIPSGRGPSAGTPLR